MDWKGCVCNVFKGTEHCSGEKEEKTLIDLGIDGGILLKWILM